MKFYAIYWQSVILFFKNYLILYLPMTGFMGVIYYGVNFTNFYKIRCEPCFLCIFFEMQNLLPAKYNPYMVFSVSVGACNNSSQYVCS